MSIYTIISNLRSTPPQSEAAADAFLRPLSPEVRRRLIAAVYLGRDHLHCNEMRADRDWTQAAIDDIPPEDYARILYEKSGSLDTYLGTLVACACASNFDLNTM